MKFFKEFKEFITRGNVLDMAVGIIIGGAFTAIVTALTGQILQPLINWMIVSIIGGDGLASALTMLKPAYMLNDAGVQVIDLANSIYIDWGAFITAIINFILVALILFIIIKAINGARKRADEAKAKREAEKAAKEAAEAPVEEAPAAPAGPTQEELLAEIRDLLKSQNGSKE